MTPSKRMKCSASSWAKKSSRAASLFKNMPWMSKTSIIMGRDSDEEGSRRGLKRRPLNLSSVNRELRPSLRCLCRSSTKKVLQRLGQGSLCQAGKCPQSFFRHPIPPIRTKETRPQSKHQEKGHVAAKFVASPSGWLDGNGADVGLGRCRRRPRSSPGTSGPSRRLPGAWTDYAGDIRSGRRSAADQHGTEHLQSDAD